MSDRPLLSPAEVIARIRRRVQHQPTRAVIVLVELPWSEQTRFNLGLEQAMLELEIGSDGLRREELARDAASAHILRRLNLDRDLLRLSLRLLLLVVREQATLAWTRFEAPDLSAMTDMVLRVNPTTEQLDWTQICEQIRDWSRVQHQWIDLSALSAKSGDRVRLEELFLSLVVQRANPNVKRRHNSRGQQVPALSLFLAAPGSGKSTFLRQLALRSSATRSEKISILVPLPAYAEHCATRGSLRLLEFLPAYLESEGIRAGSGIAEHLPEVLLLLDGLDEVQDPGLRRQILLEVSEAVQADRLWGCIIASRPIVLDHMSVVAGSAFALIRALPLAADQRLRYLRAWATAREWRQERAEKLEQLISGDAGLQEMSKRPLHLMLLALAFERLDELPRHRVKLFEAINAVLVQRWRAARSMVGRGAVSIDPFRVLGPIAERVLAAGGVVSEASLVVWLTELEGQHTPADVARQCADRLVALLRSDGAVLGPVHSGHWAFAHPSLAEHLVAQGVLQSTSAWKELVARPFSPHQREVLIFVAATLAWRGDRNRLTELLEEVLKKSRRKGQYSLFYSSLLIGLLHEQLPGAAELEVRLLERLWPLWLQARYSPEVSSQVHIEASSFLGWAVNTPLRDQIREQLGDWLSEPSVATWWDRNFGDPTPEGQEFLHLLVSRAGELGLSQRALQKRLQGLPVRTSPVQLTLPLGP